MKPSLETPPRTMMEVFKQLPEGTLAELIDNQLYMSPSPVFNHQEILIEIASQLRSKLKEDGGKVIIAPFDVYLDDVSNAVQPDIVIILQSNTGTLNPKGHFHGVPDVLIEVLSPANRDFDLIKKKALYERFSVNEYWIVDPENKKTIGYRLAGNSYQSIAEHTGLIKSPLLAISITF